jgi:HSP20 family protein
LGKEVAVMYGLIPRIRDRELMRPYGDLFDRFFEDLNLPKLFSEEKEWTPSFDISETDDNIIVEAELPGMDAKDVNVTLTNGILTVKGERKQEEEKKEENYYLKESHYGSFCRSIRLPSEIKTEEIDATYKDGVLKLTLPKAEPEKAKRIEIKH